MDGAIYKNAESGEEWDLTQVRYKRAALCRVALGRLCSCSCTPCHYNPIQDALHQLPRHQQTIIFRLRTGHCRLNSHLKRIGAKTSAQCPCGEMDQTPEHHLQSCSLYLQARQQIWPTCVSLKTKLLGSAEDLFLTCGTHWREDLVNATITSNAEEEEVRHATLRQE